MEMSITRRENISSGMKADRRESRGVAMNFLAEVAEDIGNLA